MKALRWQLLQSKLSVLMPSIKFVNRCIQTQRLSTRRFNRQNSDVNQSGITHSLILRKWDFMSFIAEKLRSHEAELSGRVKAMQTERYNSWKASLYCSKNVANSSIVHGTTSSFSFVRSIKRRNWYTSCDISSKLFPNTKFYNFSRKFWQVTALSWTFLGPQKGAEISLGARPLPPPP